ncbi:MAG TPA: M48 family metallopeptidase [Gammaproteobacteria bacterium]
MAITQAQFDDLVERLEEEAARRPAAYKLKLAAFASLGYLYVAAVLLALILVSGALIAALFFSKGLVLLVKKAVIPLVVLIGVVLKSLWVKLEPPQGTRLERRDHPRLFRAIEEVRRAARAPRAHVVLLTNDLNAAIVQVPRLGLFGWQKNYLILGLPLMQLLSLDEFKAVLAHEFGHLSGAHGCFGAWIYRVRAGWARLNESLQQQRHWGSFMFVPFFGWFAPKFAAYSFVQARRQEYEADQLAAEAVGPDAIGRALVRLDLKARELSERYWPAVYAAADRHPTPTVAPFAGLLAPELRGFLPDAAVHLEQALGRRTSTADTHPCLRDRIAALGVPAALPSARGASAANVLFGAALGALVERFDREWQAAVANWWRSRHEQVRDARAKLEAYARRTPADLTDEELFEYARLTEELAGVEQAMPLVAALFERTPADHRARYTYGRLLLRQGRDEGIRLLEDVMAANPAAVLPGCEIIVEHLRACGREAEAEPYIERFLRQRDLEERQRAERQTIRTKDTLLPHALTPQDLEALRGMLARDGEVKAAYLARKKLPPGYEPMHVLGIVRRTRMFRLEGRDADRRLIDRLANETPVAAEILFVALVSERQWLRKKLQKVPGSRVK